MEILKKIRKGSRIRIYFLGMKILSFRYKSKVQAIKINKQDYLEKNIYYNEIINSVVEDCRDFSNSDMSVLEQKTTQELLNYEMRPSFLDPLGKVLEADGKIYRGIYPHSVNNFKKLWKTGLLQGLMKNGLIVNTKITDLYTPEFPMILEHEKVNMFPPPLWTFSQTKDSAILTLLINQISNKFEHTMIDGHCANVTFHNGRAIFLDFGSFIPRNADHKKYINQQNAWMSEFRSTHIFPLVLNALGCCYLSQRCTHIGLISTDKTLVSSLEYRVIIQKYLNTHRFKSSLKVNQLLSKVFNTNECSLADIDVLFNYQMKDSPWGDYARWTEKNIEEQKTKNGRYFRVTELINQFSPRAKTALDLAGNSGFFSCLLSSENQQFDRIISLDYDEDAVEYGRELSRKGKYPVEFGVANIVNIGGSIFVNAIKSEVIVALAVTHHLLITQHLNIDSILYYLKKLTNAHIYIEFCPLGIYSTGTELSEVPEWYTEDWFEKYFVKHFNLLHKEVLATIEVAGQEKKHSDHRIIFVGEIK